MRIYIVLLILTSISCGYNKIDYSLDYTNSSKLSYGLLKTSIEATISIKPTVNTSNYVVDLSKGFDLDPIGRDSFLIEKEKRFPVTHEDSVLISYDGDKMRVLKSMIISFDTIKPVDIKTVRVVVRKIISDDTIVTARLLLERTANSYVSSLIKE